MYDPNLFSYIGPHPYTRRGISCIHKPAMSDLPHLGCSSSLCFWSMDYQIFKIIYLTVLCTINSSHSRQPAAGPSNNFLFQPSAEKIGVFCVFPASWGSIIAPTTAFSTWALLQGKTRNFRMPRKGLVIWNFGNRPKTKTEYIMVAAHAKDAGLPEESRNCRLKHIAIYYTGKAFQN